jgi:4-amino-4-deoxy-L-arabinose transferase-like glycosyltransferase
MIMFSKLPLPKSENQWLLTLFLLSLFLWIVSLGNVPLRDWDEGTYAIVAREIYRDHNWFFPTLQTQPFLLKPPLMMWLMTITYYLGGINEFTTRFLPAFITSLGVPCLYLLSKKLFDKHLPALLTALVYLTWLPMVRHGRLAMLDGMSITFYIVVLYCLLKCRQDQRFSLGIGLGLAFITLTKGMLVLLLAAIAVIFLVLNQELKLLLNPRLWLGITIGMIPAIAWYLAQYQHYGDTFIKVHFEAQAFDRLSQSVEGNKGPLWYYVLELLKYGFPWLLFLPESIYLAWQNKQESWSKLALTGAIIYFVTVSVMKTKLPWYVLPVYPFLALLIGYKLTNIWENKDKIKKIWSGILGIFVIVGLAGCVYFTTTDKQIILVIMSIVLAIAMITAIKLILQENKQFLLVLFIGMYAVLFLFVNSQSWNWEINERFAVKPVAELITKHIKSGTKIYTSFPENRPSLDFYSDCIIIPSKTEELGEILKQGNPILIENEKLNSLNIEPKMILGTTEKFTLIKP